MAATLDAARIAGAGQTGMFGCRLQAHSLHLFLDELAVVEPHVRSDFDRLQTAFGSLRFVYLFRKDKIQQAVSLIIAERSGLWHRHADGTELERTAGHRDPEFDAALIHDKLVQLRAYDTAWETWFDAEGLAPLRITYDELSVNPRTTLRRTLEALGLDPAHADDVRPSTKKLADDRSAEWIARYLAEKGAP